MYVIYFTKRFHADVGLSHLDESGFRAWSVGCTLFALENHGAIRSDCHFIRFISVLSHFFFFSLQFGARTRTHGTSLPRARSLLIFTCPPSCVRTRRRSAYMSLHARVLSVVVGRDKQRLDGEVCRCNCRLEKYACRNHASLLSQDLSNVIVTSGDGHNRVPTSQRKP